MGPMAPLITIQFLNILPENNLTPHLLKFFYCPIAISNIGKAGIGGMLLFGQERPITAI